MVLAPASAQCRWERKFTSGFSSLRKSELLLGSGPCSAVTTEARKVSKLNWNRVGFFALGTFLGGWVLGTVGRIVGGK